MCLIKPYPKPRLQRTHCLILKDVTACGGRAAHLEQHGNRGRRHEPLFKTKFLPAESAQILGGCKQSRPTPPRYVHLNKQNIIDNQLEA
jgi:hypothetical protein